VAPLRPSRIVNLLQIGLEPAPEADAENHGPAIKPVGRDEYAAFMEALGLRRIEQSEFHPFFHEVVTVEQETDAVSVARITQEYWPGYALGPLLITRAGCAVGVGADVMRKDLAERSTLYWAYTRRNRRTEDQSHGWGGNSQWRTTFRRDYVLDGQLHYNVGVKKLGKVAGRELEDDLASAEKLELVRFRCFVRCTKRNGDRWPYDLSHQEGPKIPP
jgi:hypothetical protein